MYINNQFKKAIVSLSLFFIVVISVSCADHSGSTVNLSGVTMGTSYHITLVDAAAADYDKLEAEVESTLNQLNRIFSTYITDSELSILNDQSVADWVPVSEPLFDVLMLSMEIGWLTDGAFDITMGSLVDLWGFGPSESKNEPPSQESIDSLVSSGGFRSIQLNFSVNEALKPTETMIDLSAIAKGYAVDYLVGFLLSKGYKDFMVEIGGEVRTIGQSPRGSSWKIAIEEPGDDLSQVHRIVSLDNVAVATSGDYRNYFEKDGRRYSHTIDPRTGYPVNHNLASVTVIADTAAYADALATGINVMGAEEGLRLAQQQGLAVYLLVKTNQGFESKYSDAFKPYLD